MSNAGDTQWATRADLARVEARIDGHEDVCAERMKRIDDRLTSGDRTREAMRLEMREGFSDVKNSLRNLYGRSWAAAVSVIAAMAGIIGWLVNKTGVL